ncbi:MAG: hypothetical protein KDJ76_07595, partial [Xanthobacteraceae bacterium]|nr:hypothetical protein [Xanthobacteraceae bacterium]
GRLPMPRCAWSRTTPPMLPRTLFGDGRPGGIRREGRNKSGGPLAPIADAIYMHAIYMHLH